MTCQNSHSLAKNKNFCDINCGPWSDPVRCPIMTKDAKKNASKTGSCRVLAHVNDLWPVSTAVNNNEELISSMGAEIKCYFME